MVIDQTLRAELLARFEADQTGLEALYGTADTHRAAFDATQPATEAPWPYAILEWQPEGQAPQVVQELLACVRASTQRLRQIISTLGWPGRDLMGEDGADAAWLILQHSGGGVTTLDTAENSRFRRDCVPLLAGPCAQGRLTHGTWPTSSTASRPSKAVTRSTECSVTSTRSSTGTRCSRGPSTSPRSTSDAGGSVAVGSP